MGILLSPGPIKMSTLQELKRAAREFTQHVVTAVEDDDDDEIGELEVSEYIIMLFAFDTYIRYIEETLGVEDPRDKVIEKGLKVIRLAEKEIDQLRGFLDESLPSQSHKRMLAQAMRRRVTTPEEAAERALDLRDIMEMGGARTQRAVFKTNKQLKQIRVASAAAEMEDADAALDKFAALAIRNGRIRAWIDWAAQMAGSEELPEILGIAGPKAPAPEAVPAPTPAVDEHGLKRDKNPIDQAAQTGTDKAAELQKASIAALGAAGPEEIHEAEQRRQSMLAQVEVEATEAARKAIETSGAEDAPLTRSETVGVAVAAATAVAADSENAPVALQGLDDEQRAAALMDGKVLVAAGAGAGKSRTLVARVRLLIEHRQTAPSKVLVTSFNKKAADELQDRITAAVGESTASQMQIGTMHSVFRANIEEFGTPEEAYAIRNKRPNGFIEGGGMVAYTVQKMWAECFDSEERPAPKLKDAKRLMEQWVGNDISPAQAMEMAKSPDEIDAADWYEMYEGLKGAIPGWEPPCEARARAARRREGKGKPTTYEAFMARRRPDGRRLGDFNDMIRIFRDILKRDPGARAKVQRQFDHILVDECQDLNAVQHEAFELMTQHIGDGSDGKSFWMVGDDKQCVDVETPVAIPGGETKLAGELRAGDAVMAYRNGMLVEQRVRHAEHSSWTHGFKIVTDTGKTLTMSPNHKIWAQAPELEDGQVAVYLMYRQDMGFRVGITNKCHSDNYYNSFGGRAFMEKGERMWILDICDNREEALLAEQSYSLEYGVPTTVFEGANRDINQDRVAAIFDKFGKNGGRILENKHLSFDLPHWMSQLRRTIQMTAHGAKGSQVALEWSGDDLDERLKTAGIHFVNSGGRRRLRKWFANYREALTFAEDVKRLTEANLSRRLSTDDGGVRLVTASGLFPGMQVVVAHDDGTALETITVVEPVAGRFVDLDVDDASNFIGGGIISHNSIYGFRGARPDKFIETAERDDFKTAMIRTNYRCEPEIVEAANRLIGNNEDRIPMECNANPSRPRGMGSIKVEQPADEAEAALGVIERIKGEVAGLSKTAREAALRENAVLCRTNAELNAYETACIVRGIPYARKGSGSFLGSPETTAVLGYVQLVTGTDFGKMQKALGNVLTKPNRFFISPKDAPEFAENAFRDYARKTGQDEKSINPTVALGDPIFQQALAMRVMRLDPNKRVPDNREYPLRKTIEQIRELGYAVGQMQANAEDPEYSTKNLFDDILALPGKATAVDPDTGRTVYIEQTFRESLQADLRDRMSEEGEEDDDDEEGGRENLGNVNFLYELAKPDPTDPGDAANSPETPKGFADKMGRYAQRMRELRYDLNKVKPGEKPPAVYLGTIHSTKGLEWKNAYTQMPAGKFPMVPKAKPGEPPPDPEELRQRLESERRLAYVAMTRAMKNLTIVCPNQVGGMPAGRSMFVSEAGLQSGENVSKGGDNAPQLQPAFAAPDEQPAALGPLPDGQITELMTAKNWPELVEHASSITMDQLNDVIGPQIAELMAQGRPEQYEGTKFLYDLISANPNLAANESTLSALETSLEVFADEGAGLPKQAATGFDYYDPLLGPPPWDDEGGAP